MSQHCQESFRERIRDGTVEAVNLESVRVVVEKMTLCNLSLVLAMPCLEILRRKT